MVPCVRYVQRHVLDVWQSVACLMLVRNISWANVPQNLTMVHMKRSSLVMVMMLILLWWWLLLLLSLCAIGGVADSSSID